MIVSRADAARLLGVRVDTIHQWVHRGHVTPHPDGVDLIECHAWLQRRERAKVRTRRV